VKVTCWALASVGVTARVATAAKNDQFVNLREPADCILDLTFFVPRRAVVKYPE
jgi:hypothetical protein